MAKQIDNAIPEEMAEELHLLSSSINLDMLQQQLYEIELLQAMYANPGEFTMKNSSALEETQKFVNGELPYLYSSLDFTLNILVDQHLMEVDVNLPLDYPLVKPDVYIRSNDLTNPQHKRLRKDMSKFIMDLPSDEVCITEVLSWLQDNGSHYFSLACEASKADGASSSEPIHNDESLARYWIYSHHIYSKVKRGNMLDLAKEHKLTGFVLPGKPGIICIEGLDWNAESVWSQIKNMSWKKVMLIEKEITRLEGKHVDSARKFADFKEQCFGGRQMSGREVRMDMGEFFQFLCEHDSSHIFKKYFGMDGRLGKKK